VLVTDHCTEVIQKQYPELTPRKITKLMDSRVDVMMLAVTLNSNYIGSDYWRDTEEYKVDYSPHKHTNSSHQPHPLNQGLSTLPTKGLGT
jgi:hypothetical protein